MRALLVLLSAVFMLSGCTKEVKLVSTSAAQEPLRVEEEATVELRLSETDLVKYVDADTGVWTEARNAGLIKVFNKILNRNIVLVPVAGMTPLGQKPQVGLTELVTGELPASETIVQARENLWLLAGGRALAGVKRMIDRKDFGGELTLVEALEPIEKDYDFVIVDTSPGWDPLTVNVLFYVYELITPVSLEVMTLQGLVEFLKSLSSIQKYRTEVTLNYILPTFLDKRIKNPDAILEKLKDLYGEYVCTPIRYNVRLSESPAYGKTIFENAPGSHGSQDYRDLVRKITGRPELFA